MTTTIDFKKFARGTVLDNAYQANGMAVQVYGGSHKAMIFNTANPAGGDHDPARNTLGKVVAILSEDGDSNDPDDDVRGGKLRFTFEDEVALHSITLLDAEEGAWVKLYDEHGHFLKKVDGVTANNGQTIVHLNQDGVARMDVILGGSGAVENIVFQGHKLDGGINDDELTGGAGRDILIGGQGTDDLQGGDDQDLFTTEATPAQAMISDTMEGVSKTVTIIGPDNNGNGFDGVVTYFDDTGTIERTLEFSELENIIPCFTPGTTIATPRGERPVEDLQEGDRVITRDNGIQEVRWAGRRDMTANEMAMAPEMNPVLIQAGSLGNGLPERDILVSPQHRVLVSNDRTTMYFEEREVLVSAKHLVGLEGIGTVEAMNISYIHFMFDNHEVVLSNGAWTESFQPDDYTLGSIGDVARAEIFALFPELESQSGLQDYQAVRKSLKGHEADLLIS